MLRLFIRCFILSCSYALVNGEDKSGLLLLYRPLDISNECAFSGRLRYDLSFGMGMSDTITMVFRTLNGIDYECNIDITAQSDDIYLIVVIKFPTSLLKNCYSNEDAFMIMKKKKCLRLCALLGNRNVYSSYFATTVRGRMRFRFLSNSSINLDLNAELYQVTATTARVKPAQQPCHLRNETLCVIDRKEFCFTSGVVCDGIKNCGVGDWFDERKSECSLPTRYLGYAPVIAVGAALACALLAAGHILLRFLPPLASSFFIFNANEDNRLCIDPILYAPDNVTSSSSSDTTLENDSELNEISEPVRMSGVSNETSKIRNQLVKAMAAKFHEKLRSVTGRAKIIQASASRPSTDQV